MDEVGDLDAKVFQNTLNELLEKTANSLERAWPYCYKDVKNGPVIFVSRIRITINTYNAILSLIADSPADTLRKPLLFAVAPLVRTLFEELITLLFVLHDVPNLMISLNMTGYTEAWLEREASKKYYDKIPKWQKYIDDLDSQLNKMAREMHLTPDQMNRPNKDIGRWPTPGRVVRILNIHYKKSPVIPFMEFLTAWMYRTLSGETHLDLRAIQRRGLPFIPQAAKALFGEDGYKEKLEDHRIQYHKEMTWTTFTLLLAIISEIEAHFGYQMGEKAKYLWVIFSTHSEMAEDFYNWRYKTLLA